MGGIIYTPPAAAGTTINATNNKVPRRLNATTFEDSNMTDSSLATNIYDNNGNGVSNDYATQKVKLGQQLANGTITYIEIDNSAGTVKIAGANVRAASAGASSGRFLNITVNNVDYKIDLLDV